MTFNGVFTATFICGALFAASAETCTWIGPSAGNGYWSHTANWRDGKVPRNDDTVVFASGTAATNDLGDISLAGIDFAVSSNFRLDGNSLISFSGNARLGKSVPGGNVEFRCPVELCAGSHTSDVSTVYFYENLSGAGDLWHDGDTIRFSKPLQNFTGSIFATNATITPSADYDYRSNVLGVKNQIHAGRLNIGKNGTCFASSSEIHLYNGRPPSPSFLIRNYCGGVECNGPVWFHKGGDFLTGDITFKTNVYLNGELYFKVQDLSHVTVNFNRPLLRGPEASEAILNMDQAIKVHFKASGNEFSMAKFWQGKEALLYFDAADAMPHGATFSFSAPSGSTGRGGLIITGGDQTCTKIALGKNTTTQFVTSTVPAVVTIAGIENSSFWGRWQGALSLRWSPTWAATYTLGNSEHLLSGELISDKGTLALSEGASFPNLSGIEVNSSGKLNVPVGVSFNPQMKEVRLASGAQMALNSNFDVEDLYLNGQRSYAGVYGGPDCTYAGSYHLVNGISGGGWITVTKGLRGLLLLFR